MNIEVGKAIRNETWAPGDYVRVTGVGETQFLGVPNRHESSLRPDEEVFLINCGYEWTEVDDAVLHVEDIVVEALDARPFARNRAAAKTVLEALGIPEGWTEADLKLSLERARRAADIGWMEGGTEAYFGGTWTDNAAVLAAWVYVDNDEDLSVPAPKHEPEYDWVTLEHTEQRLRCHLPSLCHGEACTMHNRSDHPMRSFPQRWRGDRGIMERICPHGTGHPDPDEWRIITGEDQGIHGCDGCCDAMRDTTPLPGESGVDESPRLIHVHYIARGDHIDRQM